MDGECAIDLYAGAGGATLGLKDAGFRVLAAVENDRDACDSFRQNHPEVAMHDRDIRTLDADALRDELGLELGELALLQACPPCQSWSSLGKRDSADPRNDLLLDVTRFIRAFLPRSFILENVPGLHSDLRLTQLRRTARRLGYGVRSYVLDATSFAVPQRRLRLIVIGIRGKDGRSLPRNLISTLPSEFVSAPQSAATIIRTADGLPLDDPMRRSRRLSAVVAARIRAIPPGGSRFDLPPHLALQCHERMANRNATAAYGRIRLEGPAPTLTTRCTTPSCGRFVHPHADRGLTLREAALLQTFPSTYNFSGTYGSIERQIGNAIPVRMATGAALAVKQLISSAHG